MAVPPPSEPNNVSNLLDALVASTLDDLEEKRLALETALHTLAQAAWEAGSRRWT